MEIVEQNDARVVLRSRPLVFWVNALVFFFIGTMLLGLENALPVGLVLWGVAILLVVLPAIKIYSFEKKTALLTIHYKSLFRKKVRTIPFSDIVDVEVHHPGGSERISVLNLVFIDNKRLTIADAGRINSFCRIQEVVRAYLAAVNV